MNNTARAVFMLMILAFISAPALAADTERKARVATGAEVRLVASGQTAAQWSARRSKVRDLRPRVRGNFD